MSEQNSRSADYDLQPQDILRHLADLLFVLDPDSTIRKVNDRGLEVLGCTLEEIVRQPFIAVLKKGSLKAQAWSEMISGREVRDLDLELNPRSGDPVLITFNISVIRDRAERVVGLVCLGRDTRELRRITASAAEAEFQKQKAEELQREVEVRKEIETQLRRANIDLQQKTMEVEEQNRALEEAKRQLVDRTRELAQISIYKSEFLANVSHELRTPLNSMLLSARILSDNKAGNLSPEQVAFAQMILDAGVSLLELVGDVLDLSKIEAGRMDVQIGVLPFEKLRIHLNTNFGHVAQQQELALKIELAEDLPPSMGTDEVRVLQVLRNLLSNAIKFTETGGITVSVRPVLPEDNLAHIGDRSPIAFTVADTGIGIAPEKRDLIFESFRQADGTTSRKHGGTGLGLSISREIARLLHGRLNLHSVEGQGSAFTLILPDCWEIAQNPETLVHPSVLDDGNVFRNRNRGANALRARPNEMTAWSHRILIVDDDQRNTIALKHLLEMNGMSVLCAENGLQGIKVLEQNPDVDLILMDIMMPIMDGYEAMREIRKKPEYRSLPIITVTAKAMPEDRERCVEVGASDYISKPLDQEELLLLLKIWLDPDLKTPRNLATP